MCQLGTSLQVKPNQLLLDLPVVSLTQRLIKWFKMLRLQRKLTRRDVKLLTSRMRLINVSTILRSNFKSMLLRSLKMLRTKFKEI